MKSLRTFVPDRMARQAQNTQASLHEGETWRTNSQAQDFLESSQLTDTMRLVADVDGTKEGVGAVVTNATPAEHVGEEGLLTMAARPMQQILGGESLEGDRGVLQEDNADVCTSDAGCQMLIGSAVTLIQDRLSSAVGEAQGQLQDIAGVLCGQSSAREVLADSLGVGVKVAFSALSGPHPAAKFLAKFAGSHLKGALSSWGQGSTEDIDLSVDMLFAGIQDGLAHTAYSLQAEVAAGRAPAAQWAAGLDAMATDPALSSLMTQQLVFAFLSAGASSSESRDWEGAATGAYHFRAKGARNGNKLDLVTIAPPRGLPPEQFIHLGEAKDLTTTQGWQVVLDNGGVQFEVRPNGSVHLTQLLPHSILTMRAWMNPGAEVPAPSSMAENEAEIEAFCGALWADYASRMAGVPLSSLNGGLLGD